MWAGTPAARSHQQCEPGGAAGLTEVPVCDNDRGTTHEVTGACNTSEHSLMGPKYGHARAAVEARDSPMLP